MSRMEWAEQGGRVTEPPVLSDGELAQEVFLRAFINLGPLKEPERIGPWLVRIARNLALDRCRGMRRAAKGVAMCSPDGEDVTEIIDAGAEPARERLEAGASARRALRAHRIQGGPRAPSRRREPGDLSLDRGYSDVLPLDESGRSDVVIRLAPDGSVSGTVVGPDGNPVEGARVSVSQEVTIANTSGAAQAGRSH